MRLAAPFGTMIRRRLLLLSILFAHGALLALVAMDRGAPAASHDDAGLSVFDVPVAMISQPRRSDVPKTVLTAVTPSPPVIDVTPADLPIVFVASSAPMLAAQDAASDGACDLTDTVQSALRSSGAARATLARLPSTAHSVANAVMLWDGHWIEGTSSASREALTVIRQVVRDTVGNASSGCRTQLQAGPRLIAIAGPPDMTLALGSGTWRWNDLVATDDTLAELRFISSNPGESARPIRFASSEPAK